MKRPWDAILWWEIRRIVFNVILAGTGILSALVSSSIGSRLFPDQEFGNPFFTAMFFAIGANACYTLGWITELLWSWGDTTRTETMRLRVFQAGLVFSVFITLLPALILSIAWVKHALR